MKTRRQFLQASAFLTTSWALHPLLAQQTPAAPASELPPIPVRPPALERDLVRQFVVAGHSDLEKLRELLSQHPGLLNATWDWGGGDFETALGGASHMGRRDIALFLLDQGARPDPFSAAMLGQLEVLQAWFQAQPSLRQCRGPHGITLRAHALKGGPEAARVVAFLEV